MPRTDVVNIGTNAQDVRKSVTLMPYSRVIVTVDEETEYEAGNTSGLTLEVYCPWGSQAMANNILTAVRGYQYQPYTATGAIVDPAAEMGDAVNVNSVYGGLYQQDITFGHSFYSDFAAPEDEQLDHEFTYESPTERRITRQTAWTKAEFRITNNAIEAEVSARQADGAEFRATFAQQASEIAARVTQRGGNNASFGWSLISTAFILYSGNKAVFTCNSGGISVDGNITARSGYIGNGSSGFTIGNTFIKNNKNSPTDTMSGVYIGTNGIGVGNGVFSVDTSGNLTVKGRITATSGYIGTAASGFEIGSNYIRKNKTSPTDSNSGVYIGTNGIGVGNGVFSVDTSGNLKVKGRVEATSGYIGNGSSGFEIGNTFIRNGMTSYSDTSHNGVFIGTNGIALGAGKFKVDSSGNLYAANGTFEGTIRAAKITGQIVNSQISDGAVSGGKIQDGAVSGGKIGDGAVGSSKIGDGAVGSSKISDGAVGSSKIGSKAVSKGKTSDGVQSSLDNGDAAIAKFNSLVAGTLRATSLASGTIYAGQATFEGLYVYNRNTKRHASWQSHTVKDSNDNNITIKYLGDG